MPAAWRFKPKEIDVLRTALLTCLALLLTACANRPDAEEIQRQVTNVLTRDGYGQVYEVANFTKVDGVPRGDDTYVAVVEYDLRFRVGMSEAASRLQQSSGSIFAAGAAVAELVAEYGQFNAGDVVHREGEVPFLRSEKGWRIDWAPY